MQGGVSGSLRGPEQQSETMQKGMIKTKHESKSKELL